MWRHLPSLPGNHLPLSHIPDHVAPGDVPDLVGLPSTEARQIARLSHLLVESEVRNSSRSLWGRVLDQVPAPGAAAIDGDVITLVVGGRPHVTVPDVRGRDEDEALSILRIAGLGTARRATRRSDRVPEGFIVRTRPRAGADVPAGTQVSYIVAAGPQASHRPRRSARRRARATRMSDGSFLRISDR